MFDNEDQEAILRFIFSREANVELALGVMVTRQRITERVIKEFSLRLEAELNKHAKQLGDSWEVVNQIKKNPLECYRSIYLIKQEWKDLYRINLSAEKGNARDFILGVWNDWEQLGQRRLDGGQISTALQGVVRSGTTTDYWPFYLWADPYRHWSDEMTMLSFLGDRGKQTVSALGGIMLTIAKSTEKIIDKVVQGINPPP